MTDDVEGATKAPSNDECPHCEKTGRYVSNDRVRCENETCRIQVFSPISIKPRDDNGEPSEDIRSECTYDGCQRKPNHTLYHKWQRHRLCDEHYQDFIEDEEER